MFRKTSGAILCPSCGKLTNANAPVCLACGRRNPGMWGFASPLRVLFRSWDFTNSVTVACVALYVVSLALDPLAALRPRGAFDLFAPSGGALYTLGMTGSVAWAQGRWWTLLTAIYLHGSLLHIILNVLWIRQLGPTVEELYLRVRHEDPSIGHATVYRTLRLLVESGLASPSRLGDDNEARGPKSS